MKKRKVKLSKKRPLVHFADIIGYAMFTGCGKLKEPEHKVVFDRKKVTCKECINHGDTRH